MAGILFFLLFLLLGLMTCNRLFADEPLFVRIWTGILAGMLGLMVLVVPTAFLVGFTPLAHYAALLVFVILYLAVRLAHRKEGLLRPDPEGTGWVLLALAAPLLLLVMYLLNTHILAPGADGGLYVGQSTYGDLSLHLGIISSLASQGTFPPEYSIFPGLRMGYPFLADSLSASLVLFGTPLRWAVLIPSYFLAAALIAGLFILAWTLLKHRGGAVLVTILFLFNGGFGFIYFLDGLRKNPENFTRMFTAFYNTPTNYNEYGIRWSNTLCDMIIPQRTTFAGWAFLLLACWLLHRAVTERDRRFYRYAGILAGLMPMIHTHSFLALGLIAVAWCAIYAREQGGVRTWLVNWLHFSIPALVLALPQLLIWTFGQASGDGFLKWTIGLDATGRFLFGWQANERDNGLWFWIKNVGLVFLLIPPALAMLKKDMLRIYAGAALIFIVAECIQFQPNAYDNNKLFYIWYFFTLVLVVGWVLPLAGRMRSRPDARILGGFLLFVALLSGTLTTGREMVSRYQLFSADAVAAAEFVRRETPVDALFLTADNHNNFVAVLTGRNILAGSPSFLAFHGIDYGTRAADVSVMYSDPARFPELTAEYRVDYVLVSDWERAKYPLDERYFEDRYPQVFRQGEIRIYAVSGRAKEGMDDGS